MFPKLGKLPRRAAVRMGIRLKKITAIVLSTGFQSYVDAEPIVLSKGNELFRHGRVFQKGREGGEGGGKETGSV